MNDQTNSATKYGIGASPRFATWNSTASSSVFAPDSWSFSRISLSSNAPINWSLARLSCGTSAALGYAFLPNLCKELHRSDSFSSFSQCHARNSSLWSLIRSCGTNFNQRAALRWLCFACKNTRILCNWSRAITHIRTARNWALHAGFQVLIFTQWMIFYERFGHNYRSVLRQSSCCAWTGRGGIFTFGHCNLHLRENYSTWKHTEH